MTEPTPEMLAKRLSEAQKDALIRAEALADGRLLVPAYSVPDYMTRIYSVHRSVLNRVGLAARAHLKEQSNAE